MNNVLHNNEITGKPVDIEKANELRHTISSVYLPNADTQDSWTVLYSSSGKMGSCILGFYIESIWLSRDVTIWEESLLAANAQRGDLERR